MELVKLTDITDRFKSEAVMMMIMDFSIETG